MTVRFQNKRYRVNYRRQKGDKEVWEVTTIRGRWLGSFTCAEDNDLEWDHHIARIVRGAS